MLIFFSKTPNNVQVDTNLESPHNFLEVQYYTLNLAIFKQKYSTIHYFDLKE